MYFNPNAGLIAFDIIYWEAGKKFFFSGPASSLVATFFGGIFLDLFLELQKCYFPPLSGHYKKIFFAASLIHSTTLISFPR